MTKLGHVGGHFLVTCGRSAKDDVIEDSEVRFYHYLAKPGQLAEEEHWGPAKDRAFAFAEERRKEGWRCKVYHHVTHLIHISPEGKK